MSMDIQICSSANLVIKGIIFLEARACFSVHSGIPSFYLGRMLHPVSGAVGVTLLMLTWVKRLPKTGAGNNKLI